MFTSSLVYMVKFKSHLSTFFFIHYTVTHENYTFRFFKNTCTVYDVHNIKFYSKVNRFIIRNYYTTHIGAMGIANKI